MFSRPYVKNNNVIKFNISSYFDFKSIKNVVTLNLVSTLKKTIIKLLVKIKTEFKIKSIANIMLKINFSTVKNFIGFAKTCSLTLAMKLGLLLNSIRFVSDFNSTATIDFDVKIAKNTVCINCISSEKIVILCKEHILILFKSDAMDCIKIFCTMNQNSIAFKSNVGSDLFVLLKLSPEKLVKFKSSLNQNIELNTSVYNNKIHFKSEALAISYIPYTLKMLYPQKIKDWYDKTLEEVFYGEAIN